MRGIPLNDQPLDIVADDRERESARRPPTASAGPLAKKSNRMEISLCFRF